MRTHAFICALLTVAGGACASSQAEQVRDARMEQAEERAEASEEAVEAEASAQKEAIERQADATEQRVEAADQPGAGATEELVQLSKERATFKTQAQERLDKLAVRIDSAHHKLDALGGKAPSSLQTDLKTAAQEHTLISRDIMMLDQTPATSWEATTEKIDQRMATLSSRVDELDDAIEDV